MAKKKKVDVNDVRAEVITAMRSQSPSEREQRIMLLWSRYQDALTFLKKTRAELSDEVKRAEANLVDAMETGVSVGDDEAAKRKLLHAEIAWQDVAETKAMFKDGVGGARDGVKGALEAFSELIAATAQLDLEFANRDDAAARARGEDN